MNNIVTSVIEAIQQSDIAFSKYITANDVGATGAHQSGFHIHKNAWPLFFDMAGIKGTNKDKWVTIKWQDCFETDSRFTYYGKGTRNEYRLTRFGKNFPFLHDDNIGDLLIIIKKSSHYYLAYVLHTDDDIEGLFTALNFASTETNKIIPSQKETAESELLHCFEEYIGSMDHFPPTIELASQARQCYNIVYKVTSQLIRANPDKELLAWINAEFQLFKTFENRLYADRINTPFETVEELVKIANTILNRRKSRAGKSLEHHLAEIFNAFELKFAEQANTEGNKKPDFLFPGEEAYRQTPNENKLFMLASKTTCKDRWRQVLNEADRIKIKHLFTLQQGISRNQLNEMYKYGVCLVVPLTYLKSFPAEFRDRILTLNSFVHKIKKAQYSP